MTRLLQYTSSPAKLAIKNSYLIGSPVGYGKARYILKNRFGNHHLVAQRFISGIKSSRQVHAGPALQQFPDELAMAFTTLKGMTCFVRWIHSSVSSTFFSTCPNWVRAKWHKKALDNKRDTDAYTSSEMFVDLVQVRISE